MITCYSHYDIFAKTRGRMTTAITFSRQNDAGSRARNTEYLENLAPIVVLVLESKALCYKTVGTLEKFHSRNYKENGYKLWARPFLGSLRR